jgi:hypothetical protein
VTLEAGELTTSSLRNNHLAQTAGWQIGCSLLETVKHYHEHVVSDSTSSKNEPAPPYHVEKPQE